MFRWLAVLVLVVAVGGCGADESATPRNSDRVTYVTAFGAVGRDAFVWVAARKGYFARAGIDVTIQNGAGNVQNLRMIKTNQAQFGALDFTGRSPG